ncbi:hypothetical protein ABEV74_04670 [Paenibacillus cisolokensis]|uniref:hypothetical protein n=1 Tax=Paenibacillus cisolokensis TaxID=1658519 RepID=UPI003D278C2E
MDRKTLEYMEERAKKARLIVNKIDRLSKLDKQIESIRKISVYDQYVNGLFSLSSTDSNPSQNDKRLIEVIKPALRQMIADEVAKLEAELAEL